MPSDEQRERFSSPAQPLGLVVAAWFLFKLLAYLHLSLIGRVTEGQTGLLPPGEFQEAEDEVIYFYRSAASEDGGLPMNGWRRNIDYGGKKLTIVYSPIIHSFHATSLREELEHPMELWRESTYVVRVVLSLLGVGAGFLIYLLPRIWPKGGIRPSLMPGLTREDPMNPR
jgi:hypothetical protein